MAEDTDRPQDAGRRHRRTGRPSPETAELLTRYQAAMRTELASILDDVSGTPAPAGLLDADAPPVLVRPSLKDRAALWDLGIKLGRELGSAIDAAPETTAPAAGTPRARRRVDYG